MRDGGVAETELRYRHIFCARALGWGPCLEPFLGSGME